MRARRALLAAIPPLLAGRAAGARGRCARPDGRRPAASLPDDRTVLQRAVGAQLGLRVLGTGIDEYANAVTLMVVMLEERARDALAARYGAGAMRSEAKLTPVG